MPVTKTSAEVVPVALKQIDFVAPGETVGAAFMQFADPAPRWAVIADLSPESIASSESSAASASFEALLLPAELPDHSEWHRKARQWIESTPPHGPAAVRIVLDQGWVQWRQDRAVIVAPANELDTVLAAIVDFTYHERELRKLEDEIAADWGAAERDVPLVHDVSSSDLKRARDVGAMTRQVIFRRMRFARLEPRLLSTPPAFRGAARTAARRLRARANIESRLEAADAQIEVCQNIYELANQRMGEYSNFIREFRVEWLIIILLLAELLVMAVDLCEHYFGR